MLGFGPLSPKFLAEKGYSVTVTDLRHDLAVLDKSAYHAFQQTLISRARMSHTREPSVMVGGRRRLLRA